MTPHLEPTYLRYIYDGLIKGSIHPENAAELPDGLIGLYEEAFDERTSVVERQKLLQRFAIWALLKKEVSAAFVAEVLGETEDEIQDFISKYSAWFNSPESGKYQLYHERLKVYLLQKLSEGEIHALHEKLIVRLEKAIQEQKADEFEWYGLEFLAEHFLRTSQIGFNYDRLNNYVNSEKIWGRQFELSNGYNFCLKTLEIGIKEAARRKQDFNSILSIVNYYKIILRDSNSSEEILIQLKNGDFKLALSRVQDWDIERQFKMYLLMLNELTLGDLKKSLFKEEACKSIIENIEKTPTDFSILDWVKFFPEVAIYMISIQLKLLGISSDSIWLRGNFCLKNFSKIKILDIDEVFKIAGKIEDNFDRSKAFLEIVTWFCNHKQVQKAIDSTRNISDEWIKSKAFFQIVITSRSLIPQNETKSLIKKISNDFVRIDCFLELSNQCLKENRQLANYFLEEAKSIVDNFDDLKFKCMALVSIVKELLKQKKLIESLELQNLIFIYSKDLRQDEFNNDKSEVIIKLAQTIIIYGEFKTGFKFLKDLFANIKGIEFLVLDAYINTASELINTKKIINADKLIVESQKYINLIKSDSKRDSLYLSFSRLLWRRKESEKSLKYLKLIKDCEERNSAYCVAAEFYFLNNNLVEFNRALLSSLDNDSKIDYSLNENNYLQFLFQNNRLDETFFAIQQINEDNQKTNILRELIYMSLKNVNFEIAIEFSKLITDDVTKSFLNLLIFKTYLSNSFSQYFSNYLEIITEVDDKISAYLYVAKKLYENGDFEESKEYLNSSLKLFLEFNPYKNYNFSPIKVAELYFNLSYGYNKCGDSVRATELMTEANDLVTSIFKTISKIDSEYERASGFRDLFETINNSIELSEIDFQKTAFKEALNAAKSIHDDYREELLWELGLVLCKKQNINEALNIFNSLSMSFLKDNLLADICKQLIKKDEIDLVLKLLNEIEQNSWRNIILVELGCQSNFTELKRLTKKIVVQNDINFIAEGFSKKIKEEFISPIELYPLLFIVTPNKKFIENLICHFTNVEFRSNESPNFEKRNLLKEVVNIQQTII